MPTIDLNLLERSCRDLLAGFGVSEAKAARVAAALVDSDRVGHTSHGVRQIPYYVGQLERGELDAEAEPIVIDDRGAFVCLDGCFGFGHLVAQHAAELAATRAQEAGAVVVAVRNANHVGRLGAYTRWIAERGYAALLFVNLQGTIDQQVAPFGAVERRLTNNPISFAVPGGLMLDVALSVAAEGRVHQAAERHEPVPRGWLLDANGVPTTDPGTYLAGGSLLPIGGIEGGHKGYGMIVLVEALVGLLAGGGMAGSGRERFSNAFVLVCVDPGDGARREYLEELTRFASWVKSARRRPGVEELLLPGEPEARTAAGKESVELDEQTLQALRSLAERVDVDWPGGQPAG